MKLLLALGLLLSCAARAADTDDIYAMAYVGNRLERGREIQLGGIVGYTLLDGFGVGLVLDQMFSPSSGTRSGAGTMAALELRGFLEPFEVAGSFGGFWPTLGEYRWSLQGSGAYLLPLTPSLAARAELRFEYLTSGITTLLGDIGVRFLF